MYYGCLYAFILLTFGIPRQSRNIVWGWMFNDAHACPGVHLPHGYLPSHCATRQVIPTRWKLTLRYGTFYLKSNCNIKSPLKEDHYCHGEVTIKSRNIVWFILSFAHKLLLSVEIKNWGPSINITCHTTWNKRQSRKLWKVLHMYLIVQSFFL